VEGDVFRRHAVDAPLGLGEDGEDRDGAPRHRGIERGAQQHRADVAEGAVVRVALGRRDEEAPSREDAVVEALGRGHDARRQVEPRQRRAQRPGVLGPGVEQRRGEHVARHAPDGVEMDMHGAIIAKAAARARRLPSAAARRLMAPIPAGGQAWRSRSAGSGVPAT
jgi:hypothetical protein